MFQSRNKSRSSIKHMEIIFFFILQFSIGIFAKDCFSSLENNCSEINSSNLTELSLINSFLTDMPDFDHYDQLVTLHLDNNQIHLIHGNSSTLEYLSLTWNQIYALHLNNLSYPKLKYLDLSHNPIEHIIENFFSFEQFPRLEILKLTSALKHINPYLIDNRLISFSSLINLKELYFDENDFEEFSCSNNISFIQWNFSSSIEKIFFGRNRLVSFDEDCFIQLANLTELDFHSNDLKNLSNGNRTLAYLSKLRLDDNFFVTIPSNFLQTSTQLIELNLSANQLDFKEIRTKKSNRFPTVLRSLYLDSMSNDLSCATFENLIELEQLHLANLSSTRLENCLFNNLSKLKTLNLRHHRLKIIDEEIFRPVLMMDQFYKLDLTSSSLRCDACSLRWIIHLLKSKNITEVNCLDQHGKELLLNTLNLPSCLSSHTFPTMIITISLAVSLLVCLMLCIYTYQHRKFPFSKFSSVYQMIPLRNYDRIQQNTTDDLTNDNVMLVT